MSTLYYKALLYCMCSVHDIDLLSGFISFPAYGIYEDLNVFPDVGNKLPKYHKSI